MRKIEELRAPLGKVYTTSFGGVQFAYKPTNLLIDISTQDNIYVYSTLVSAKNESGEIIVCKAELHEANNFMDNIERGNYKERKS